MFRAHRQAWAWQDEWHGLTMDDIRELERQTQLALQKKMGDGSVGGDDDDGISCSKMLSFERTWNLFAVPFQIQVHRKRNKPANIPNK